VPAEYVDRATGERRFVSPGEIYQFCNRMRRAYGGYTQANPIAPPLFRGYWEDAGRVEIDELTLVMVLVPSRDQQKALRDFTRWKRQLEQRYNQQIILVMFYPVQILGDL
jgi:hypothetical protein